MTSRSHRTNVRILIGVASILSLIAFSAFTRPPANRTTVMRPVDGIPGPPESMPGVMDIYVQQIDFGAGADPSGIFESNLPCGEPARCGGKASVRIRIVPSNYATSANWDGALGNGNGYVVAKVSNLEGVPYDRLNLGPYEVGYVWVGDSQGLGRTTALYAVRAGSVKRLFKFKANRFCRTATPLTPAVHINTPPTCAEMTPKAAGTMPEQASIEPFTAIASYAIKAARRMLAPPPVDAGLWISCSLGCCEVQF